MKFKKRVLRAIHEIGGCDAADVEDQNLLDGSDPAVRRRRSIALPLIQVGMRNS